MKHTAIFLCVLIVCTLCLCSCGDGEQDGVLIIPSSRGETALTDAVTAADTVPPAAAESAAEDTLTEPTEPVPDTEEPDAAVSDDGMLASAQALIGDPAFRALLEQYGVDAADSGTLLGTVAAVLAYGGMSDIPGAEESDIGENTVFWTDGGSVWHVTENCSALAKSKTVLSGTRERAMADGKTRVCKRCGD